jgi:hypothetical protein
MNLTIDIAADLESRLLEEAARQGMDPREFVVHAIRAHVRPGDSAATHLDAEQSRLVEEINRGLAETEWKRYYELIELRQQEALGTEKLSELTELSRRIEEMNTGRMGRLSELARLRGTTLPALLRQLGIVSPPVM